MAWVGIVNTDVVVHLTADFPGLKQGQPSFFWDAGQRLFEEPTAFLNDNYCQSGVRSSPRTWKNVASALAFWFKWCGAAEVDWHTASRDDLIDFRDGLATAISPVTGSKYGSGTIIAYMQPVIAFYDYARRHDAYFGDISSADALKARPAGNSVDTLSDASRLVPARRAKKHAIRPFRTADLQRFLAALGPAESEKSGTDLRSSRDRLMADWGWVVGLRLSEILALNPYQFLTLQPDSDAPFVQQAVEVVGKGCMARNVAVPNWLIADTLRYMAGERAQALRAGGNKRGQTPKVLFVTGVRAPKPGTRLSARRFEAIVEHACMSAGLVRLKRRTDPDTGLASEVRVANHSVHDLRHTYAVYTYWVEARNGNSAPWKVVQAQLGHARLETTVQTYLKFVQLFGPRGRRDIRDLAGLDSTHD